ncbi:MAG: hypothetical protein KF789_11310 [Bdellovibrionaceae bacterium]|nr:hypothetical protein [Pseudobdellovibrionaceae bacterium]
MRVFIISFCCVAALALGLLGIREWALMIPSQRFEHAFLNAPPLPYVAVRVENSEQAKSAKTLRSDVIFWLDLRMTADGEFLILNPELVPQTLTLEALGPEKWKGPNFYRYTEAELRLIFPQAVRLKDFLSEFPEQRAMFNIVDNTDDVHTKLLTLVEPLKADQRFLFQSDTDIILKSLKEKKPLWLYGSSRSDLMKILTFESLGLEAASPFRGDVFISTLQIMGRDAFNQGVLKEIKRRHKDIFIGPLNSTADFEKAQELMPEGFIFASVELFKELEKKLSPR